MRECSQLMRRNLLLISLALVTWACSNSVLVKQRLPCKFRMSQQAQVLVGKQWKEISIEAKRQVNNAMPSSKDYRDITGQFSASDLDDVMVFSRNGTYVFDEGNVKARPESAQIYESGNWCICKGGKELALINGPSLTIYNIVELHDKSLVLQLHRTNEVLADTYLLRYIPLER
jgi:hypothetical protein